jgi:hypothetical protein
MMLPKAAIMVGRLPGRGRRLKLIRFGIAHVHTSDNMPRRIGLDSISSIHGVEDKIDVKGA